MWNEMRQMFSNSGMRNINLNEPGTDLYYYADATSETVALIWMISDRKMRDMNRMEYQEHLSAIQARFRGHCRGVRITSLFLTAGVAYADILTAGMDPKSFGFYVINPIKREIHVDPNQEYNTLAGMTEPLARMVLQEGTKAPADMMQVYDWNNPDLWEMEIRNDKKNVNDWYSGRRGKLECKVTKALIAINVICFIICLFAQVIEEASRPRYSPIFYRDTDSLREYLTPAWLKWGGASSETVLSNGEFYRLVTACFLHANLGHILGNMIFLLAFGDIVEKYLRRVKYFILYMLAGVLSILGAVTFRYFFGDPEILGIGASGAIFGVMGALAMMMICHPKLRKTSNGMPIWALPAYVVFSIAEPILVGMITGVESNTDFAAHVCGFISGAAIFFIMDRLRKPAQAEA